MRKAALLGVVATLVLTSAAFSQPPVGSFCLRGMAGVASQSLDDWNDDILWNEQYVQGFGYDAAFAELGGAIPFGIEAGYQVHPFIAFSVAVLRQSEQAENSYSGAFDSGSLSNEVELTSVTANTSFWIPGAHGLFLGAAIGAGFGSAKREARYPSSFALSFETWEGSGHGMVGGPFLGYEGGLASGFRYHARLSYQFQNLGVFDGTYTTPFASVDDFPPEGQRGEIETDFSGVQLLVGIGVALGGR